ncbi:MAG: hypothetical protein AB7N91_13690 [Candidatus Tectimicrobiota bacterium]
MRDDRWQCSRRPYYGLLLGLGVLFWGGDVLLLQKCLRPFPVLQSQAQAQEATPGREHHAQGHEQHGDLVPFMLRNAYHLSTLYHAARAAQWELAEHEVDALGSNLDKAAEASPIYAGFLRDFKREHVEALDKAVESRQAQAFAATFQAAVHGCNDCHKATKHAFIVIPETPPNLSIFSLPPASGRTESPPAAPQSPPQRGHQH